MTTRVFEVDLREAGLHRPKDFKSAVGYLKRIGFRYNPDRKVWTLTDPDGDSPEDYELWMWLRIAGVTYTEVSA